MANTSSLSKEERKKTIRASRKKRKAEHPLKPRDYARGSKKKRKAEHPLKPRDYARGSKKSKVKKLARGQSKRG
ncbi:MAG: hypothetical protein DMG81_06960 [Acidobacteria bacterium]|nr:MAG: hypothetical protein DMG81_06960 [Acidobacteriota bacterium]